VNYTNTHSKKLIKKQEYHFKWIIQILTQKN